MKKWQITLSPAEAQQLLSYLNNRDREGWYYGRKDYFEARHQNIKRKLEELTTQPKGDSSE